MIAREAAILRRDTLPAFAPGCGGQFMIARKTPLMVRYAFAPLARNGTLLFRIHRSKSAVRFLRLVNHDHLPDKATPDNVSETMQFRQRENCLRAYGPFLAQAHSELGTSGCVDL